MICLSDVSRIIRLLGTLENTRDLETFFGVLVAGFEDLLNITSAVFIPYDQSQEIWCLDDALVHGHSSEILSDCTTRTHSMDPFVMSDWIKRNESRVALYEDFVGEEEYSRSDFFRNFSSRIPIRYCLCLRIQAQDAFMGLLGLHRKMESGNFGGRECEIADVLSVPISSLLHRMQLLAHPDHSHVSEIGFLVVGENGEILWSNQSGRRAIKDIPAKSIQDWGIGRHPRLVRSGGLTFRVRNVPMNAELTLFLKNGLTGQTGKEVRILSFEPVLKEPQEKPLLDCSGLTPKHKGIVIRVINGYTNREIARDLGIGEQTVKDHLHDIFSKLGIRSRNELTIFFRL